MRTSLAVLLLITTLVPPIGVQKTSKSIQSKPLEACRHMKTRHGLAGYERGGPYRLEHFRLTKGRTDLREFLWKHWHSKIKGIAEARVGTVNVGTVKVLYLIQPDEQGRWGIDVGMESPNGPAMRDFSHRFACPCANSESQRGLSIADHRSVATWRTSPKAPCGLRRGRHEVI